MPLYILVPMILVGLPLVIGLVYLTTRREPEVFLDDSKAVARFKEDYPNAAIRQVVISEDGDHAFLILEDQSGIGLVSKVGKNYLTRLLSEENVGEVSSSDNDLFLKLQDFTLRSLSIRLDNENERQKIIDRLT